MTAEEKKVLVVTHVLLAWNSACAVVLNFLPQSLQRRLLAVSPGCRSRAPSSASSSLSSSIVLSALLPSQSTADPTVATDQPRTLYSGSLTRNVYLRLLVFFIARVAFSRSNPMSTKLSMSDDAMM